MTRVSTRTAPGNGVRERGPRFETGVGWESLARCLASRGKLATAAVDDGSTRDNFISAWRFATSSRFRGDHAARVKEMLGHVVPVCKMRSYDLTVRNLSSDIQFWISDQDIQLATVHVAVADVEARVRKRGRRGGCRVQSKRTREST